MIDKPLKLNLYTPPSYWKLKDETRSKIFNSYDFPFISNKIWGLNINEVTRIHKYCYYLSQSIAGKEKADRIFLNNLLRMIDHKTKNKYLLWLRRRTAIKYYKKMKLMSGPIFWQEKNKPEYLKTT